MTEPYTDTDPSAHMLSLRHYERRPDGTSVSRPIPLDEFASDALAMIGEGRDVEASVDNDWRTGVLAISKGRADAIAAMLDELAARLEPGLAVAPIRSDGSMAEAAGEMATALDSMRHRSPDYD